MKFALFLMMFFGAGAVQAGEYTAAAKSVYGDNYVCKDFGNRACAQSKVTGQCTREWSDKEDGGMYACQVWTGEVSVKPIDKSNYKCKRVATGACAVDSRTGQCTHVWKEKDGGMFQCKKWTGEFTSRPVDKNSYYCRRTPKGYCAVKKATGQCTFEWSNKEEQGAAKYRCEQWIARRN